jgi:DNA invertase Pin-like site-specific DNA recombinase
VTSTNAAKRAGIYTRISSDPDGKQAGVARQQKECRELAARRGLDVVKVYEDNDVSAFKGSSRAKQRPAYAALLADIEAGSLDVVIAWHPDRLHRDWDEQNEYVAVCAPRGVSTYTVTGGDLHVSTSNGRWMARVQGATNQQIVEHMIERMVSAHAQRRETGLHGGGTAPYGYRRADPASIDPGTGKPRGKGHLDIDPGEAAHIRRAYASLFAGKTLAAIARELNAAGSRIDGREWQAGSARRMLLRATNAGLIEYRPRGTRQGKGAIYPGAWEPIIDEDTWRAARAILLNPGRRTTPGPARAHLLAGVLVCGVCGDQRFGPHRKSGRVHLSCRKGCVAPDEESLDQLVITAIVGLLRKPESASALHPHIDIDALNAERTGIRARLDELAVALADPDMDIQSLTIANKSLNARLNSVQAKITSAMQATAVGDLAGAPDVAERWAALDFARQRAIVTELVRVTVMPALRAGRRRPGEPRIDPRTVRIEFTDLVRDAAGETAPPETLTRAGVLAERRREVAQLAAQGMSKAEIARTVGIHVGTVRSDLAT